MGLFALTSVWMGSALGIRLKSFQAEGVEKSCCCKSEDSKLTSAVCDAKGYTWVKGDPTVGKKNKCCTLKKGGCPFCSHYKKVEEGICAKTGYSIRELWEAGATAGAMKQIGHSADELRQAGYTVLQVKQAGYTTAEMKKGGFSAIAMKAVGSSAGELQQAGYTAVEMKHAQYTFTE